MFQTIFRNTVAIISGLVLIATSCSKDTTGKDPVTTTEAEGVTVSTARLCGRVDTDNQKKTGAEYGIIYSTDTVPTEENGISVRSYNADGITGDFSVKVSGLKSGTEYFYRAYTSSTGLVYLGQVMSFTTETVECDLATGEAGSVSETRATLNGTFDDQSVASLEKSFWFLYSTTETTADGLRSSGTKVSATISSEGRFISSLTGLAMNTQYHFMACGRVYDTELFGEVMSFTTGKVTVEVTTQEAASITETKATLRGQVTVSSIEAYSPIAAIYYSPTESTAEDLISSGTKMTVSVASDGSFSTTVTGLQYNTRYYYVATATAGGTRAGSEVREFTTRDISVAVTTADATSVSETKAKLTGSVSQDAGSSYTPMAAFYYSATETTAEGLISSGTKVSSVIASGGTITASLAGLNPATTYYFLASATVAGIRFNGDVRSFATADFTPEIATGPASDIGGSSATVKAEVKTNSIETIPASQIEVSFYYSPTATTAEGLVSSGTKVTGSLDAGQTYKAVLQGLSTQTTYYFVSTASVAGKKVTGSIGTFTTIYVPSEAVDLGLSVLWCTRNLGADSAGKAGGFYSWGETATKNRYDWTTYSLCNGAENTMKAYCTSSDSGTVDGLSRLDLKDDAARATLGQEWRMPTSEEMNELRQKCTWKWTTQDSAYGYKVTGTNGNSIFLPAAGYWDDSTGTSSGSVGMYWCSDLLDGNDNFAVRLYFHQTSLGRSYGARYLGYSIRPVMQKTK